jgi:hypothetical protein
VEEVGSISSVPPEYLKLVSEDFYVHAITENVNVYVKHKIFLASMQIYSSDKNHGDPHLLPWYELGTLLEVLSGL